MMMIITYIITGGLPGRFWWSTWFRRSQKRSFIEDTRDADAPGERSKHNSVCTKQRDSHSVTRGRDGHKSKPPPISHPFCKKQYMAAREGGESL